jgi:hypothetical protein
MYTIRDAGKSMAFESRDQAVAAAQTWAHKIMSRNIGNHHIENHESGPKCLSIRISEEVTISETITEEIEDFEDKPVLIRGFLSDYVKIVKSPVKKNIEKTITTVNVENRAQIDVYVVRVIKTLPAKAVIPSKPIQSQPQHIHGATSHLSSEIINRHRQMFPNATY